MTDTLTITPGQVSASLDLRRTTALAGCTTVDGGDGRVLVRRNWPNLSSGEELLWAVLAWLSGRGDLPDDADLRAGLDTVNYAAVRAVLEAERVTLS